MPDIQFVNPHFKNIDKKEISIQVSLGGFSIYCKTAESGECLFLKSHSFKNVYLEDELFRKVGEITNNETYLNESYLKAEVTYIHQKVTLVPKEFFAPENILSFFEFNHTLSEYDELHYKYIQSLDAYCVFSMPNYLSNLFYSKVPGVEFNHQAVKLISHGLSLQEKGFHALVGLNAGFFDIGVFEDKQLLLYNSFQFANALDFIYFFLYPLKQLKIDTHSLSVTLFGDSKTCQEMKKELKSYVKNIRLPELVHLKCPSITPQQMAEHFYLLNS